MEKNLSSYAVVVKMHRCTNDLKKILPMWVRIGENNDTLNHWGEAMT